MKIKGGELYIFLVQPLSFSHWTRPFKHSSTERFLSIKLDWLTTICVEVMDVDYCNHWESGFLIVINL